MTITDLDIAHRNGASGHAPRGAVPRDAVPRDAVSSRDRARMRAWFAVLGIGATAAWLGVVGVRALLGAGDLAQVLSTARGRTIAPALLVFVGVMLLAERLWPAVRRPLFARAHLVDFGYLVLFATLVLPLLTVVETGVGVEVDRHARFLILSRLPVVPEVVVIVAILIGIDAMNWVAHVANHRSLGLWRLHALHHSQEDMSVLTTFRTHPLVHATYLPALFPALILGASGTVPLAGIIVYSCLVTLPHANLRWTLGPLGRIFVSPAFHRLHHVSTPLDERGTVNFGFALVCWDQLARRAVFPTGGAPVETGISGRPVPIEQSASAAGTPRVVLAQLAQPFRLRAETDQPW
jgi:sterol desaturase/sphingolipid hydroxylase (fatty acid hydroxylase superfamily)